MRIALLPALLLILFAASTAQAQADPYQWVGVTSIAFTGGGNGQSFVGMTTQCRADYGPGARMCKSEEIMDSDTLNLNSIPADGCWVRPSWRPFQGGGSGFVGLDESGFLSGVTDLTCGSWSISTFNNFGLVFVDTGGFDRDDCGVARPVACCKPTPVPAPTSSLSLPVGLGALAGLVVLKGGA